jgi:small subunit ribosomal protein S1
MSENFAEMFEQSITQMNMRVGEIITGEVVDINRDVVIVNAGLKSEGVIPVEQFYDEQGELDVKIGDTVEVALDSFEDGYGESRLSREKAKRARAWTRLEEAQQADEIVTGRFTGKVKGGFTVDIGEIRAFLPGSLVDVRPVRDTAYLEEKELEFKIIKLDQKRNNVVVSRRAVVEREFSEEREKLLETLKEGERVRGIVKNLTDYGAFLDLGGIDGLLHITDMAWKRVKHPSEVVEIGQEIDVVVLKFDREKNRVSLGLKQIQRLFGHVSNITDYGCFVEIEDGVEGLVHVSEMDWTNKNVNPNKVVTLGDEVEVVILEIDEERRRISLGMKQCKANPWEEFGTTNNKGDIIGGKIKSITDFGIFIGLDGNIDGLIHLTDLSWNKPGEEAVREYQKGQEVEAMVLSIDPERERISLGIKQIEKDPFASFIADKPKGSIVTGTVISVDAKAAVVDLGDGIEGLLRASEMATDRVEDARSFLNEGDQIDAKITGMDRKGRSIYLSIKAKDSDEEQEALKDYAASSDDRGATTSFGDLLKEKMDS